MQACYYVHPDNLEAARRELDLKAAVIARPDAYLEQQSCRQLIVETKRGIHNRCFLAPSPHGNFLIVYGRFDRLRTVSSKIDFELTQEVISCLGITKIVGTFAVGSIKADDPAGTVFIPHDLIGFGGFQNTRHEAVGFRNVDSFRPFCERLRESLIRAAGRANFPVRERAVYACFHGYPRIETLTELNLYEAMGCEIVGQTLDPEATLAREAGCHYAAIAATIDDHAVRTRFLNSDHSARGEIDQNLVEGRSNTFRLFLAALEGICTLESDSGPTCNCSHQSDTIKRRRDLFYYRPPHLIGERKEDTDANPSPAASENEKFY